MENKINQIFNNLDKWKNLPKYQLERRLDIFLTPYLNDILFKNLNSLETNDLIIPEFPINVNLVNSLDKTDKNYNSEIATKKTCFNLLNNKNAKQQSFNIDYLMFSKDKSIAYFIELKTDNNSFNDSQKTRMLLARDNYTFNELLFGLKSICNRTKSKEKYSYLIELLTGKKLEDFGKEEDFITSIKQIEIVYLLPIKPKDIKIEENIKFITFKNIIDSIQSEDVISERLKNILTNI